MASASAYLAEAFVTRKQFKEKVMKKMDNNNEVADIKKLKNSSSSSGGGCFSPMKLIFKRVHPNTTAAAPSSDEPQQLRPVEFSSS
ncbi:hypothetical protein R3W88_012594 [Solanum pinnatisectum]|uniref:Uncharacterized protein n=1 Tax=Solanum pinnatisectum TaxID=50273 RepID=A0AAV9LCC5_9SOLN|nr:hypothetical protein R3W88_012592 [Solanum pinnatisectum]KAK4722361.1 hypothetical protein R3W88_012594 [Solanum pinnatisectum]